MPKVKHTLPEPSREKGQRSLDLPQYLDRNIPIWQQPEWLNAERWRFVVANQPFATTCRDTLIANTTALDWKIEPRDSTKRDEYRSDIQYYENFLQNTGDYDYVGIIEWVGKDMLDTPFGGIVELGREGDSPQGKLLWIAPIDAGTCYPTLNKDWPVQQQLPDDPLNPVVLPAHAVDRIVLSPRTEIRREGWGMPPPEKIYLSLILLNRGDRYYANLLLDTPEVGILDLGDMEKQSAEEWVKSWHNLLSGIDPFKIPVLYEHTSETKFIAFNRSPQELMFDKAIMKYAGICAAGYGMSLSDIGMQVASSGGETLAGSIRQERRTRRTGNALMKKKFTSFFNKMLPEYLQFKFIDLDDEVSIALGRSRLANATAWSQLIQLGAFTPEEARLQTIADGLISISVPEKIPQSDMPPAQSNNPAERPSLLGRPIPPSAGGQGEIRNSLFEDELDRIVNIEDVRLRRLIRSVIEPLKAEIVNLSSADILEDDELQSWNEWHDEVLWGNVKEEIPELTQYSIATSITELSKLMTGDGWWELKADPKKIADDMLDILRSVRLSKLQKQAELAYEKGETETLQVEFEENIVQERQYRNKISKAVENLWFNIPDRIKKATISGARRFLSLYKVANELDIETIMVDNKATEMVREELFNMRNDLIEEFSQTILNITKKMLED